MESKKSKLRKRTRRLLFWAKLATLILGLLGKGLEWFTDKEAKDFQSAKIKQNFENRRSVCFSSAS